MSMLARHEEALERLKEKGRLRKLTPRAGLDFASNDYLGLSAGDALRRAAQEALDRGVGLGAGGARLLRGNDPEHSALEAEAAAFFGAQKALFMGGGFTANSALFATLPAHNDLILHDALVHASAHDGMRLGRAQTASFAHNDANAAQDALKAWRAAGGTGRPWIAVESVYSMDGDIAPIDDLFAIAQEHEAMLVVDEAHATGVWGPGGRGFAHQYEGRENVVSLHTCGKALGASGALICAAAPLIDTMINKARGFIFATAPSPLIAAVVRAAIGILRSDPSRVERLRRHLDRASELAQRLCGLPPARAQIIPVIIGADKPTMALAERLQNRGFDIRGVRPPTVPRGTSRLRISITLNTTQEDLHAMFAALAQEKEPS